MSTPIVGAAFACLGGVAIAWCNDWMTRAVCRKKPSFLPSLFAVRQLINVAYLAALYFLSALLPWEKTALWIGGAVGITVPSIFFALRFARMGGAPSREPDAANDTISDGKERE